MRVAAEGEAAVPRVPAPPALRPILGFGRLSAASYASIQRVVEDDGIFRARVAEAADEAEVGRAGWLWLHRPVDWADDPVFTGGVLAGAASPADQPVAGAAPGRADKAGAARLRKAAAEAEAARKQAAAAASTARKEAASLRAERDGLAARVAEAEDARREAVAKLKATEAALAEARRELKVLRKQGSEAQRAVVEQPSPAPPADEAPLDRTALEGAVLAAADASAALAAAVERAASLLDLPAPARGAPATPARTDKPDKLAKPAKAAKASTSTKGPKAPGRGRGKRPRVLPSLPPGVFDDTPEAARHLIASKANLLVVDGYNLARAAWSGLGTEEERRRTVGLLEDVQARSGAKVVVVFDGDSGTVAPRASKAVRVAFSATGETADDAIAALVAATPHSQPVVVVSSDRAVAVDARSQGAATLSSAAFLRAAGR